ncbi:hypothetical protein [Kocuria nitroreducens]|uniref:hypothetical protein n=1 Tax=Kocuria nitroreducens TaxID=3058914 RepID=UPI0036DB0466
METQAPSAPGFLAFLVRILEQLSLSAWFPGALVSASLALLWTFRDQGSVNLPRALSTLTDNTVAALLLTIPVLLLATSITQAFSYSAIRFLEGYWFRNGIVAVARCRMIKRHARRKAAIERRKKTAAMTALTAARKDMLAADVPHKVLYVWEREAMGLASEGRPDFDACESAFYGAGWRAFASPWHLSTLDSCLAEEKWYPDMNRILPTRLGNVLRATEDDLHPGAEGLEGFVAVRRPCMSLNTRIQHDQFRTRLDMYSIMVFVCAFLAAVSPVLLIPADNYLPAVFIVVGIFVLLTTASYRAAIFSAQGYCAVLRQIDTITP